MRPRSTALALAGCLSVALAWGPPPARAEVGCPRIELFTRAGCPHCERAREFLEGLRRERPSVVVVIRDVEQDLAARRDLRRLAERHRVAPLGVPAFSICDTFFVGFRDAANSGEQILRALGPSPAAAPGAGRLELPWLGPLDSEELGLVAFTVALGLLDGLNPCAMWVLLILLSVLVGIRDRRKLLLVAGCFVAVSGVAYFVFMAAWLNIFLWIGWSRPLQLALGGVAVGVGLFHAKDCFAPQRGPSLSIPAAAKPRLYRRVRGILGARSLGAALAGAIALAVSANAVELLCTAGLPALYTQILSTQGLSTWQYYGYLALYNLAYMADDLAIVSIAVVTLHRFKLQERHGRWLKGLSGGLMLALGLTLWFRPEWLSA